jgi:hypothetical protein
MRTSHSDLQDAINALVTKRNSFIGEVKVLHSEANTLIKGAQKDTSFTNDERETRLTALRAKRQHLKELHDVVLTDEFVPAHKAARDALYDDAFSSTQVAELYAKALKIFEDAYLVVHPKTGPAKKTAPKADDKDETVKDKKTDDKADPKPAPAPVVDKDDDKAAKKDDSDSAKKTAPKADDKAGKDEPVSDIAGLATLIKEGQAKCDEGFTAVNARIADVAKGTLPEDIAKVIREAGLDRVKALFDGTAPTAGLSVEDRKLLDELNNMLAVLRILYVGLNDYENPKILNMLSTLGTLDKGIGGLLHFAGGSKRTDTPTN